VPDTVFEPSVVDLQRTARVAEDGYDVGGRRGHRRGAGAGGAFAEFRLQAERSRRVGPRVDVRVGSGQAEGREEADGRGAGVEEPGEVVPDEVLGKDLRDQSGRGGERWLMVEEMGQATPLCVGGHDESREGRCHAGVVGEPAEPAFGDVGDVLEPGPESGRGGVDVLGGEDVVCGGKGA